MKKELIFIGLGRMGSAMVARLVEQGYVVHGFDVDTQARALALESGVYTYESIKETIVAMDGPRVVWVMAPSSAVDEILENIYKDLNPGDIVIDGGNSFFEDTKRRAAEAKERSISYVDCGTSGGVDRARTGASLMVGGEDKVVQRIEHIFETLATTDGYAHVGGC